MVFFTALETMMKFQNYGQTSIFSVFRKINIEDWENKLGKNQEEIRAKLHSLCKNPVEWEYFRNFNLLLDEIEKEGNKLLQEYTEIK
jgi:hypothetical protein